MYMHENGDRYAILTDEGLDMGDGTIVKEGLMLEIARKLEVLLKEGNDEEFFMLATDHRKEFQHNWTKEEIDLFQMIVFPEYNVDVWNKFWDVYHKKVPIETWQRVDN